jgi:hypothetical protein
VCYEDEEKEGLLEDTVFNISPTSVTGAGVNIVSYEEDDKEETPLACSSHTTQDVT